MKDWIEYTLNQLNTYPQNTGVVVGILHNGEKSVFNYGRISEKDKEAPQPNTLFEIGSVSKVFTTTLLSILISEGLLNLDDPVREITPELANLPPGITPLQLATHTSGLPKMPSDIFKSLLRDRRNPYAAYSISELINFVSKSKPNKRSGGRIQYSNLGMGLLGYVLERISGMSYEEALIDRICDPLNLLDTRITLAAEHQSRLAPPHNARGHPAHNWDMPAFAGAGGLRGTLDDLIEFLDANMTADTTLVSAAMQTCHEFRTRAFPQKGSFKSLSARVLNFNSLPNSYRQGMALGWYVGHLLSTDNKAHWHHGATGGYRSFIGFVKDTNTGVAVVTNSGPSMVDGFFSTTATDHLGFRILEKIQPPG